MSIAALVHLSALLIGLSPGAQSHVAPVKCCDQGFVLGDDLGKCIAQTADAQKRHADSLELSAWTNQSYAKHTSCFQELNHESTFGNLSMTRATLIYCVDFQRNGSLVHLDCSRLFRNSTNNECNSIFFPVYIYGASMLIFANIVYLMMYSLVILTYVMIPKLCRRAYDKAVLCFILTQGLLSVTIVTLGHFLLCHKPLSDSALSLFGITIMIFTISGTLWLGVISLDVASTITRLRWVPSSGGKDRDENHKFRVYLTWVIVGTILPVTFSSILQFSPLSDDYILKPNFHIMLTVNFRVVVHVITVPAIMCVASNILFFYTTIKMIKIQNSTSVANKNRKRGVKQKYILYLKLYIFMDAPWITGALGSIYEFLWLLKFVRVIQPIVLLYAVLPRDIVVSKFSCRKKSKTENNENKPAMQNLL